MLLFLLLSHALATLAQPFFDDVRGLSQDRKLYGQFHDPSQHVCSGFDEQWGLCPEMESCSHCSPEDCVFEEWGQWFDAGGCTQIDFRQRSIQVSNNECGKPCEGNKMESRSSPHSRCIVNEVDCQWAEWSSWTDCGTPNDQSTRSRTISQKNTGQGQPCIGDMKETRPCSPGPSPEDCLLSDWHEWSECSSPCGPGVYSRFRKVIQEALHEGRPCDGVIHETDTCEVRSCDSMDCEMSEWSEWSSINPTEEDAPRTDQLFRKRTVVVPPGMGGSECPGGLIETKPEIRPSQPCVVGDWSFWSECDRTCAGGQKMRERSVEPAHALSEDEDGCGYEVQKMIAPCGLGPCHEAGTSDCQLSEWDEWSECSSRCGTGSKSRSRSIVSESMFGGNPCEGPLKELAHCELSECNIVNCRCGDWSGWSDCSCECGGGTKRRTRHVAEAPRNGGKACEEEDKEEAFPCSTQPCGQGCIDGKWGAWGEWTHCSASCASSYRSRSRNLEIQPSPCGKAAAGYRDEFELCTDLPPCIPDSDCEIHEWGEWSHCSCHCFGIRERNRYISHFATGKGKPCPVTALKVVEPCNPGPVTTYDPDEKYALPIKLQDPPLDCQEKPPVNCELHPWNEWQLAECSVIDFEVIAGSGTRQQEKSHRTLARCSIPLAEVLEELQKVTDSKPMARKLYSPLGQGPFEELHEAKLTLAFSSAFGDRLHIKILSVKGMQISITKPMYVRATCRQNCASNVQSLPSEVRGLTGCRDASRAQWHEVQFEIPVYIGDSHVQMSPDHRLHFQVLSRSQGDKAIAEMFLPLRSISESRVKPFELTLLEKGAKSEGKGVASLCLAFQAVVPCPKQLRCRVDCCNKVNYGGEIKNNLQVRMQMVEGDPMVCAEAVRTTPKQSAKPAWKQKCTLPVPEELLSYGRTLSVRKGWVHEQRDAASLAVCVDIYDRSDDSRVGDRFMCRGYVPFREAWEATKNTKGFSTPKTVDLTPSTDGKLQMSFMSNTDKDQLIVNIISADKLPGREPSGVADAYCVVRLAELGQLGEPTDQASPPMPSAMSMPGQVLDASSVLFEQEAMSMPGQVLDASSVLFEQEDVLDLPGVSYLKWRETVTAVTPRNRDAVTACKGARDVMESFYSAVNGRDLDAALKMVDDDVLYEDFTFQEPFRGREGVRELLGDAMSLPKGLDFIIDDVAGGESWSGDDAVGMTWHVEFDGVPLPNSRGASLYKTKNGKLSYARDIVESPLKLGSAALGIVGFIATLVRSSKQGLVGSFVAFATAASLYWYILLLSPQGQFPFLGGPPAWAIDDTTLRNVIDESLNFFYIWPGLDSIGLPSPSTLGLPLPEVDALRLALFNLAEAYAFMLLPLLLWDRPQRNVYNWWAPAMFLTNAILLPYFATRALAPAPWERVQKPSWSPIFGVLALLVVAVAIWQSWGLYAGLPSLLLGDRVTFAFAVDATLFAVLQAYVFAETAGPAWRFVPFFGLAVWLILPDPGVAEVETTEKMAA